jgi:hypothetical protein
LKNKIKSSHKLPKQQSSSFYWSQGILGVKIPETSCISIEYVGSKKGIELSQYSTTLEEKFIEKYYHAQHKIPSPKYSNHDDQIVLKKWIKHSRTLKILRAMVTLLYKVTNE